MLPPAKEVLVDVEVGASGLLKFWLRITRILEVQDKHAKLIETQAEQIACLRDAVHILQAREELVLARAETAAIKAAGASQNDLARRIGHLEERSARYS